MDYSNLIKNIEYCIHESGGCGVCEKSEEGCNRTVLLNQCIESIKELSERERNFADAFYSKVYYP